LNYIIKVALNHVICPFASAKRKKQAKAIIESEIKEEREKRQYIYSWHNGK